jgi:hypothetical protein
MANKVKIYSTLKSGKVNFDGARVNSKEIGSLAVEAHPTLSNRIRIKSLVQFKRGSETEYRVFFGKLNINRIQNEAGENLVDDLGMDRDAVIAYIQTQITKPIVTEYFEYNPVTDRLEANKNIEVKKHGFFIGGKYKMASGNSNLYYEDLATGSNSYPVMGEVLDQSIAANQAAGAGATTPKMRVFGDFQTTPLGGVPVNDTAIGYDGDNYFPFNISGVGITCRIAEPVTAQQQLKYEIVIDGISVYIQYLEKQALSVNQDLTWFFDHPLDVEAGTTLRATIYKVSTVDNQEVIDGILQVCEGDATPTRYQTNVMNRRFEDKDLELISPYLKYQAMDFSADATGSNIVMKNLSLPAGEQVLTHHPINGLQAVADGSTIQIKIKDGAKILVESLPVSGASINGTLVNSALNTAVTELNTLFTSAVSFAQTGNPVSGFALSGNDLTITLSDGTSFTSDVTTLGVDTDKFVVSGAVNGSDLVLTMDDATTVTIDATNLVSGSTLSAINDRWYISYGSKANTPVGSGTTQYQAADGTYLYNFGPYYFGQQLTRGSEFRFNMTTGQQWRLGIWDGAEAPVAYNQGQAMNSNWGTVFAYLNSGNRFVNSTNTDVASYQTGTEYVVANGAPLTLRFDQEGHLTLIDLTGGTEAIIGKTTTPQTAQSINLQFGGWAGVAFPNGIISTSDWSIVHDFDNSQVGILNGLEDHTIIRSNVSIGIGEKIMFHLDEDGQGDFFGTNYTGAASGVSDAEETMDNHFKYDTNEGIGFSIHNASDWNVNTNATYYFNNGAGFVGYRKGSSSGTSGTGLPQGMFSLRFNSDGKLTIFSEDNNEKVATAKIDPQVGSSVHLYFGVRANREYTDIPVISKQTIGGGSQPVQDYSPTVANQTVTVTEGDALNFQIVTSDNIVNQFVETDAPSWMSINQTTGVLSGTAPAYAGTAADTIVVNCKAGNAVGGTTDFTVTVTIAEIAYTNNNSLQFTNGNSTVLQGNASNVTALQRAANGSGASDAWSISLWVYPSSNSNQESIFYYGGTNPATDGAITLEQFSGGNISLAYGITGNTIVTFGVGTFPLNQWNHVLITYSGAATGTNSADLSSYYSSFGMYVNGSNAVSQYQNTGNGFSGAISGQTFRIGRYLTGADARYFDGKINQVGIWDSDQSANVAAIYNAGATQDLSLLAAAPVHYYEIETSTSTISDITGSADLIGYNFSSSDLITDTP